VISSRRDFLNFGLVTAYFAACPVAFANVENKILILIELSGANDGLNTVIPYRDSGYRALRRNIGVPRNQTRTITRQYGLHPSLLNLSRLFEQGDLAIVQGLGYPNPVLSHFRSIELWERGGDGKSVDGEGWLNAALELIADKKYVDAKAINLDFNGDIFAGGVGGYLGPNAIGYEPPIMDPRDATVPIPEGFGSGLLDEIITLREENHQSTKTLRNKLAASKSAFTIGSGPLGSQLSRVCQILQSAANIPVFKVSIGSFDTHISQYTTHGSLLRQLDISIAETVHVLKDLGLWENAIIMTYSEFGRRAKENSSSGTDHGMAAPHFVLGGKVNGGVFGTKDVLGLMADNNLVFSLDYRALYNEILSKHFEFSKNKFSGFVSSDLKNLLKS